MNQLNYLQTPADSFEFSLEHVWELLVHGFIPAGGWIFLLLFGWLLLSGLTARLRKSHRKDGVSGK